MIIKETLIGKTNIHCPKIGFGVLRLEICLRKLQINMQMKFYWNSKSGINLYDTSPLYGYGLSEKRLGSFFKI